LKDEYLQFRGKSTNMKSNSPQSASKIIQRFEAIGLSRLQLDLVQ
jgi:hypothetical protein